MVALQAELAKLANVHAVVPSTAAVADSIADMILADLFKEMMSNVKRIGETLHSGASEARKASKAEGEVNVQAEEVEETPMPALPPVSTTAPSNAVVNVDDSPSEVAVTVPPSDMPLPQAPQALPLEEDIEVVTESEVVTAFVRDELLTYLPPPPSTGLYTRPPLLPGSILRHVQKKYGTHHKDSNLQPARERATFPLNRDTILLLHSLTNEALQRIFNPDMTSLMATTLTLLSSRGMTRQQVVAQCTRLVGQWSAYVDENGENLDQLLVREVKSSERAWRAGGSEEIGEKVAEGLWEECLESAVKELKRLGEKRNV
ncbi:hypothetical protein BC832DRAFT_549085 [Gaertneriomyces semiglobifer]|nr:hypothetical protein BC832DRAFT_549085 [Gaertneriomyces semiglobifer]